jgi:hypothetical protein
VDLDIWHRSRPRLGDTLGTSPGWCRRCRWLPRSVQISPAEYRGFPFLGGRALLGGEGPLGRRRRQRLPFGRMRSFFFASVALVTSPAVRQVGPAPSMASRASLHRRPLFRGEDVG